MNNYRYDEFADTDNSVLLTGEAITVPASSPYYVPLLEIPREELPSTVLVRTAGSSSTVTPDQDCSVDEQNPSTNGNGGSLYVGRLASGSGGWLNRSFIRFDISALPAVASVAKLRVYCSIPTAAAVIGIHKVTSSWTETAPIWSSQPTYDPVAAAQYSIPAAPINAPAWPTWFEADITALYNVWKSSGTNYGLMLKGDESVFDTYHSVMSSESGGALLPQLVVVDAGDAYTEVSRSIAPSAGEFAIHYGTGRLRFHSGAAGLSLEVDYRGLGSAIDAGHVPQEATTTGSANTYVATVDAWGSTLRKGYSLYTKFNATNTGASTLNVNGLGAKTIQRLGAAVTTGQIVSGTTYLLVFDGTYFQMIGL